MNRDLTFNDSNFLCSVPLVSPFLLSKAKGYIRYDVPDQFEIAGIIVPYLAKIPSSIKGDGYWSLLKEPLIDFDEKPTTQKMMCFEIKEGKFFEIDVLEQGIYIISYNGKNVEFSAKSEFSVKDFEEKSKTNIEEKEKAELKAKQSASVKPFIIDFNNPPPVSIKSAVAVKSSKKDLTQTDARNETHKPFAGKLNPKKLAEKDLKADFDANFPEEIAVNK